ncbi:MAG TPA: hypothetical protein VFE62_19480 [Gemmataceae bacterium]|nr:hypothetical protein [Gemmataceae bacterium]
MADPTQESPEEFAPTREHEYQDSHYHDEEPEIVDDEEAPHAKAPPSKKKNRCPPPRPRWYEE